MFTFRRQQLQTEQAVAAASLAEIEFRLALIERMTMKFPDCVIKKLPAETIIGTTVLLGDPPFDTSEIGLLFGKVARRIRDAGGDVHVGVGLYSDSAGGTELPSCSAATLIHKGPMSRIGASWQHLSEWCLNQG
ncbi:hypothetical protein [Brevibacterium marinum]|uniref:Effector-binding domain-containing protein n=1 Tax=Brevibacterium marinum TaxID=418643 RepID=A0A846S1R6_9MICO|nr:hypothetical protein [Brevibacterium marinum]NJC55522.1 effector-binding domain-containing protein [Brevibacterium marinum]